MLSFFKRVDNAGGQNGVHRGADGFALAQVIGRGTEEKPVLAHCSFESLDADDALSRAVRHLPNRKLPSVSVLPSTAYHMLLVEAPQVPNDELRAAVRWRIKDLIDFHIDDAVIDVFQMPNQGRGGPNQMMYAIAAKAEGVRAEVRAAEDAGLNLQVVDIVELSLRNIATRLEQESRGLALLYLADTSGVLLLVRNGTLYLTRRIETGTKILRESQGLRSELVAGLALETRRSLDYFESHYEQSSIPVLYTSGLDPADQDQLRAELGLSVRNIELSAVFDGGPEMAEDLQRKCLPAIGAALRHDSVTL